MKLMKTISIVLACALAGCLSSCEKKDQAYFSGRVLSNAGRPIAGAMVSINNAETETGKDGKFSLRLRLPRTNGYLITVRKFGFGLFSRRLNTPFSGRDIFLTEGTVTVFDPSSDVVLVDRNSFNNPFKPELLSVDTAKLFDAVPQVFDAQGKLVDLGYPAGFEHIFDYLKIPVTGGQGISVRIRGGSLVDKNGNAPAGGVKLSASLSTVDFFNPDGMPGNYTVKTKEGFAYMESYGAGTIQISDGRNLYNLKDGATADLRIPVYPVRLMMKEKLDEKISLLRFNEKEGYWEPAGTAELNRERNAYEVQVNGFSVLNMDMIKTGPSKCFKIRQILRQGATDNSGSYFDQYRAVVVVPQTPTSPFKESSVPSMVIEDSAGCVPVQVSGQTFYTSLHPITRIPNEVQRIAVVFIDPSVPDILGVAFSDASSASIPAETAVNSATLCADSCNSPACSTTNDPHDAITASTSDCNLNPGCWLSNCAFIPFKNLGSELEIVGIPMGGGSVKIKWVNQLSATGSMRIMATAGSTCGNPGDAGVTEIFSKCNIGDCGIGSVCRFGEMTYSPGAGPLSLEIEVFGDQECASELSLVGSKCYSLTVN
jgi:hypothetical protein